MIFLGAKAVTFAVLASIAGYRKRYGTAPTRVELGESEWRTFCIECDRGGWLAPIYLQGVVVVKGNW